MQLVYFSITGQTRRFVHKLDLPAYEIDPANPFHAMQEPYILLVPTYDQSMTDPVNDFLEYQNNREWLCGVAGSGNRNFAELFIFTAKDIAREYQTPLLFAFEFSGTDEDVKNFKKVVDQLESEGFKRS